MDWLRYKLFSFRFVLTVIFHTDPLNLKCLGVLTELGSIPNQASILATLSKRSSCEKKFSFFQRLASLFTTVTFNFAIPTGLREKRDFRFSVRFRITCLTYKFEMIIMCKVVTVPQGDVS